jgi:hypothetical protein
LNIQFTAVSGFANIITVKGYCMLSIQFRAVARFTIIITMEEWLESINCIFVTRSEMAIKK